MEFSQCQLPCSRLITSGDQQSKCVRCMDLAHARDAIFGISNCKYCKNFTLKTVRAKLEIFDWESAVLPHCAAPEASSLRKATAWSSDAELEAMKSEQFSLSLSPSPGCHHGNSPVQFSRGCLAPSLEARWAVSFGLEDVLYTAASDSEDFRAASLDVLTPSGQEAWPSPAYTELVDVLACATEKLRLVWPDEPHEPIHLSVTSVSSVALLRDRRRESCLSSLTCIKRFPDLGSSLSPPASLMRRTLTSPTSLVLWSRGMAQSQQSRTRSLRTSRRLLPPRGSPALSLHPIRVEPPLLCSLSPIWERDRQLWLSTLWPSFRPTKRRYWRRWMRGTVIPPKLLRSFAGLPT